MNLHITKRKSNKYLRGPNLFLDLQFGSDRIANIPSIKKNAKLTHLLYIYYYYLYIYTKLFTISRVLNSYHSKFSNYAIKFKKARLYHAHISKYKQYTMYLPLVKSNVQNQLKLFKLNNNVTNKLYSNSLFRYIKYKKIQKQGKRTRIIRKLAFTNIYLKPQAYSSRLFRSKQCITRHRRILLRRKFVLNRIKFNHLRNHLTNNLSNLNVRTQNRRNIKHYFRNHRKLRIRKYAHIIRYYTPKYKYYNVKVMPWFLGKMPNKYLIYNYKYSPLYKKIYKQTFFKTIKRIIRVYTNHLLSISDFLSHVNVGYTIRNISKLIRYVRSQFKSKPRRTILKMYFLKKSRYKLKYKKPINSLPMFRHFKKHNYNEIKRVDLVENNFYNSTPIYKIHKIALHISQYKRFVLRLIRKDPEVFNFYMTQLHFWRSIQTTYLEYLFQDIPLYTFNYVPFFLSSAMPLVSININVLNFTNLSLINKIILFLYHYQYNCIQI